MWEGEKREDIGRGRGEGEEGGRGVCSLQSDFEDLTMLFRAFPSTTRPPRKRIGALVAVRCLISGFIHEDWRVATNGF